MLLHIEICKKFDKYFLISMILLIDYLGERKKRITHKSELKLIECYFYVSFK